MFPITYKDLYVVIYNTLDPCKHYLSSPALRYIAFSTQYHSHHVKLDGVEVLSVSSVHHLIHLVLPRVIHKVKDMTVAEAWPFPKPSKLLIGGMNFEDIKVFS